MDHKMKRSCGKDKLNAAPPDSDIVTAPAKSQEIEEGEEVEAIMPRSGFVHKQMENFAGTHCGQMLFKGIDRLFKTFEETAKWSLPRDKKDTKLERPLPWILFLGLIVYLRIFRICFSVLAKFAGYSSLTPQAMVYFFQVQRRRLRAIRFEGIRAIRNSETEKADTPNRHKGRNSVLGNIGRLLNSAICKPGQQRESPSTRPVLQQVRKNVPDTAQGSVEMSAQAEPEHNLTVSELLNKFASESSDNDADYVPSDDDNCETSQSSTLSAVEGEQSGEPLPGKKDDHDGDDVNEDTPNMEKVKENGEVEQNSQRNPVEETPNESRSKAGSEIEEKYTPTKTPEITDTVENGESKQVPLTATEVVTVPPQHESTPTSAFNYLIAPQLDENKQKSTPGHETAASVTFHPTSIIGAEKKSYRTVTTQTAIELDWTITIKTEITHNKHYPKLERLNHSVKLSPASSTEDVFYSPMGSMQDFRNIFHPAPIFKDASSAEAKTSAANETVVAAETESGGNSSPEVLNQKKGFYHNKHQTTHHYYNAKNRNKNRR